MAFLRKSNPGSAEGDLHWESPDDIVEVPDELAAQLLRIPDGGFSEVLPEPEAAVTEPGDKPVLPKKKADLQAIADTLGLDSTGTVAELTARIEEHLAAAGESPDGGTDDNGETETPEPEATVTEPDAPVTE